MSNRLSVSKRQLRSMPELKASLEGIPEIGDGDIFLIFAHADDEFVTISQAAALKDAEPERRIHWILASDNSRGMVVLGT